MNEFSPNVHFIDAIASSKSKTVAEDEMSNHFYLVYLSATVPFIIGFLIGFITKVNLAGKFILSAIIGTALLYTQGWGNEIFIGHPDVLLSVVTVLIPFYIMKAIKTNSFHSSSFKLAALIGFGMSIKFSFVTFIPSILLSKYNGNFKIFMRSFFYILIVSLIFYFIIGFPQNFISIPSIIKFLFFQSSISIAPNFESIARWILLIYNDLKYTLPLTIFLIFFLSNNTELEKDKINRLNLKLISWLLLILILPILLLFYQNYVHHVGIGAADHYVLPYQAFILSSSSLLTIYVKKHYSLEIKFFSTKKINWKVFSVLLISYFFSPGIPETINEKSWNEYKNKLEYLKTAKIIKNFDNDNTTFLKTAYATSIGLNRKVRTLSKKNIERFLKSKNKDNTIILMLSWKWYVRFEKDTPSQYEKSGIGEDEYYFQKNLYENLFRHNYIKNLGKFKKVYEVSYGENLIEQYWKSVDRNFKVIEK